MEQNKPIIAIKMMHIIRFAWLVLRKGLMSKKKLILDLKLMMKRGKLARKALTNLMFHHHNNHRDTTTTATNHLQYPTAKDHLQEFEFSCSNTPLYHQYIPTKRSKQYNKKEINMIMPLSLSEYEDMIEDSNMESVDKVLDMVVCNNGAYLPGLGFGPSPMDSPFPNQDLGLDICYVDQIADEFIKRFYSQLKQQI